MKTSLHRHAFHITSLHRGPAMSWWRHQMEPFSALLALCAGNSPVPVNSLHKGQWRGALVFSLICAWINDWVNKREAGDLRRHRGHYDVNVMWSFDFVTDVFLRRAQLRGVMLCNNYRRNIFTQLLYAESYLLSFLYESRHVVAK